ncbi:MAG: hypothetical protein HF300_18045 [Ignavibacteria bacterium]|jgi:hypothetical protein|nr:hypothetical protein [Ignavibacteria bacterium]MCU7514467.1 hypothetical protein [Ignavibacteria bacterium]
MNSNQVISLEELKEYLGWKRDDTSKDIFFDSIIDAVSQLMEDYCNTKLKESGVTEILSGSGTNLLILSNRHVTSLSSLKVRDGAEFKDCFTTPEEMSQVILYRGKFLYRCRGCFEEGVLNYQASYVCGFSEIPADLKLVAEEMCALVYQNSLHGEGRLGLLANRPGSIRMFFLEELPRHRAVMVKYMNVKV